MAWNRHVNVGNDPVNFIDPTGMFWLWDKATCIGFGKIAFLAASVVVGVTAFAFALPAIGAVLAGVGTASKIGAAVAVAGFTLLAIDAYRQGSDIGSTMKQKSF